MRPCASLALIDSCDVGKRRTVKTLQPLDRRYPYPGPQPSSAQVAGNSYNATSLRSRSGFFFAVKSFGICTSLRDGPRCDYSIA